MITIVPKLDEKYVQESGTVLMTGAKALVRRPMMQRQCDLGASLITAGFIFGYRGPALGGFNQAHWKAQGHLKTQHVKFYLGLKI